MIAEGRSNASPRTPCGELAAETRSPLRTARPAPPRHAFPRLLPLLPTGGQTSRPPDPEASGWERPATAAPEEVPRAPCKRARVKAAGQERTGGHDSKSSRCSFRSVNDLRSITRVSLSKLR